MMKQFNFSHLLNSGLFPVLRTGLFSTSSCLSWVSSPQSVIQEKDKKPFLEGLEPREVPLAVRNMFKAYFIFGRPWSYSGQVVGRREDVYNFFLESFLPTQAVKDLCFKLRVPYSLSSGYSLGIAAAKLHQCVIGVDISLQEFNVFLDIVKNHIEVFFGNSLLTLFHLKFKHPEFDQDCYSVVLAKFLSELENDSFTIEQLCKFSTKLIDNSDIQYRLLEHIWNYITKHANEIPLNSLAYVYTCVPASLTTKFTSLREAFIQRLPELDLSSILIILKEVKSKSDGLEETSIVDTFVKENTYISLTNLLSLVTYFLKGNYVDTYLLSFLLRDIPCAVKNRELTAKDVGLVLSYLILARAHKREILEEACQHFLNVHDEYGAEEVHCLLKAIGILRFIPESQRDFFQKIENYLMENFYNIDCLLLLDMFVYLVYVNRIPVTFCSNIFAPLFLGLVQEMADKDFEHGTRNLQILANAFTCMNMPPKLMLGYDMIKARCEQSQSTLQKDMLQTLKQMLEQIIGDHVFTWKLGCQLSLDVVSLPTLEGTYVEIKAECVVDPARINVDDYQQTFILKIAFLVMDDNCYCQGTEHVMMGMYQANIFVLKSNSFIVFLKDAKDLQKMSEKELILYLKTCIAMARRCLKKLSMK